MDVAISSNPTPQDVPPSHEAAHAHGPPSGGQVAKEITGVAAKLKKAMNGNGPGQDAASIQKQIKDNLSISQEIDQIQGQINDLKNSDPPAAQDTIDNLESQLAGLNKDMAILNSATYAVAFSYMGATNIPATPAPSSGSPILSVPVPTSGKPTTENKVNLMLAPSLATLIFSIMEKVVTQKLKNIDTYRQFMTAYIGQTEQFALSAAQSTMMQGQLQAQATMAQATGLLVSAGLQMGLGIASISTTAIKVRNINAKYDAQEIDFKKGKDPKDPETVKGIQKIKLTQQQEVSNELQSSFSLRTLQLLEQTAPNIAQGIGQMVSAQYTIQAATAEASKMLFQQAIQAAQSIYQDMGQEIQSSSQDISAFLQAFTQISSSLTQQS